MTHPFKDQIEPVPVVFGQREPTTFEINRLSLDTGYGLRECQRALQGTDCNMERAHMWLKGYKITLA